MSFLDFAKGKIAASLAKSRSGLLGRLQGLFSEKHLPDADALEELEAALLAADCGTGATRAALSALGRPRVDRPGP